MSTILEYKCPCCGGAVSFDSTQQKMVCPYCDAEFDIEALKNLQNENVIVINSLKGMNGTFSLVINGVKTNLKE